MNITVEIKYRAFLEAEPGTIVELGPGEGDAVLINFFKDYLPDTSIAITVQQALLLHRALLEIAGHKGEWAKKP